MSLENVQLHLVDSVDDAAELMRWLSNRDRIAFDTETTGLDVQRDRVRLVQVGDGLHGWTIPWERWGGVVEELVRKFQGEYIMHNMAYDWSIVAQSCGIELPRPRVHDTRIMAHVLRPDLSTALKKLASLHVDPNAAVMQRHLDEAIGSRGPWTWETVPVTFEPYWMYAALDTVLTYQLCDVLEPKVMAEAPSAYDIERAATWVTVDMSRRGIRVDVPYTHQKFDAYMDYVREVENWCVEHYGVKPGQNASVIERLTADGIEFTKVSEKTGAASLDKEVLGGIDHPLAKAVLTRRQVQKVASTYLRNFLQLVDDDDLLHPRINTLGFNQTSEQSSRGKDTGVKTGRMSMDTPNLQNLSRRAEEGNPANVVRNCLVSREGHTLLMIDFAQIEARMFAHLANDPDLRDAFQHGDFFTNVARSVFGDETITKKDPRRQPTKNGVYAKYYGAGTEKFADTAGITVEQAAVWNARFDQIYPRVRQFQSEVSRTGVQRREAEGVAYVRSPLTGRRYACHEGKEYVLVNYLIQGTAAEVLKLKLAQLAAAGMDEFMVLPVHDEVIMDVPDDRLSEVAREATAIMCDDKMFTVPLLAEPAVGKRWGEKKDYDTT